MTTTLTVSNFASLAADLTAISTGGSLAAIQSSDPTEEIWTAYQVVTGLPMDTRPW